MKWLETTAKLIAARLPGRGPRMAQGGPGAIQGAGLKKLCEPLQLIGAEQVDASGERLAPDALG